MAVPTYDEFFLPLLTLLTERDHVSLTEAKDLLANRMGVTSDDRHELLPSGRQRRYDNRVGWARTYLTKAELIRAVKRGVYELTDTGHQLMATKPEAVTVNTLMAIEPFRAWREAYKGPTEATTAASRPITADHADTPEEAISAAHVQLRQALALELAEALQNVTWQRFEEIVVDVLLALGYGGSRAGAGHAFRKSGDGGVDGVINEDRLGLSKIYVQAKRKAPDYRVSRPDVQAFVGSLMGQKAKQGVFITTSGFTQEARDYASSLSDLRVVLIDGENLAEFMIDHDVGVSEQERYIIKRLDRDYFEET
ncbi:MAG: restriction endonuclease [Truepera sp.]|jgi:restriction system protein|nr:restriction endonuclease [Truepera sp.]